MIIFLRTLILFCLVWWAVGRQYAHGTELIFSQGVGGSIKTHIIKERETLVELARQYDVGYNELIAANPGMDAFIPETGIRVTIPVNWILPDIPERQGIVINLSEMRLYYFHPGASQQIDTFPIAIGDDGWNTPTGTFTIVQKTQNPVWHVPASIRRERPWLPKTLPPGPDNPLGSHALRLSNGKIMIHGTNRPFGIGRKVSHGCIHLYPEDIAPFFEKVPVGTKVTIVRQQVKAASVNGWILVEIHDDGKKKLEQEAIVLLQKKGWLAKTDSARLKTVLRLKSGMPMDVSVK